MMNRKSKTTILTIIIITCLIIPVTGTTNPLTVTSTGPAYVKFEGSAQGQCLIEMGTKPTESPDTYYSGSGNITINGETEAKIDGETLIANGTATANGNMYVEFNGLTVALNISKTNTTSFFKNYAGQPNQGDFVVGSDFGTEIMPNETQLLYAGTLSNGSETETISGSIAVYIGTESDFANGNQTISAIIYGQDNQTVASIIWAQEEIELPFGTLNAADVFERSLDIYSVAPCAIIETNASGACVYGVPSENDSDPFLFNGNGSLTFNAVASNQASMTYVSDDLYLFNDGVYALGSIHVTMQGNQTLNADIYTNSSSTGTGVGFQNMENASMLMMGNIYNENNALQFNGTIQNASGTQNIQGIFLLISLSINPSNSTSNNYLTEAALLDENEEPIIIGVWAKENFSEFEADINLTAADSFTRTIDLCPSACTFAVSGNQAIKADHTATTGAKVTVDGSQLPTGTEFNITTVNYGLTPPIINTGKVTEGLLGARYFDIRVIHTNGSALSSSAPVQVSLTDSSFNSLSAISYWNGTAWVKAANQQFTAPNTITANIPASALTGTPVMVDNSGTPTPSVTPSPSPTTTPTSTPTNSPSATATPTETPSIPELNIVIILGLMVLLTVFVAIVRLRVGNKALKFGSTSSHI